MKPSKNRTPRYIYIISHLLFSIRTKPTNISCVAAGVLPTRVLSYNFNERTRRVFIHISLKFPIFSSAIQSTWKCTRVPNQKNDFTGPAIESDWRRRKRRLPKRAREQHKIYLRRSRTQVANWIVGGCWGSAIYEASHRGNMCHVTA